MDHQLALTAGYTSLAIVGLASAYYPLYRLLDRRLAADATPESCRRLRSAVALARATHPYMSSLISLAAAYHVYVMWFTRPPGLKVISGLLVSGGLVLMANSGWVLKFRPGGGRLRRAHRTGMYIMFLLLTIHLLA